MDFWNRLLFLNRIKEKKFKKTVDIM